MSMQNKYNKSTLARDYKPELDLVPQRKARKKAGASAHWMGLIASIVLFTSVFFVVNDNAKATRTDGQEEDNVAQVLDSSNTKHTIPLAIPGSLFTGDNHAGDAKLADEEINWETTTVKNGDNLALIFNKMGLSPQELYRVMQADKQASKLKRLMPGQEFKFQIKDKALQQLVYKIDALNTLNIKRDSNDDFVVSADTRQIETRVSNKTAVIDSSLFLAGMDAGMSDNLIMELAGIFGWDVDFALDIRSGDRFTLVYEEQYLDGRKLRDGNILAAEFVNRGKTYRALRYTDASGQSDYYSPDGKSMRKEFIRTPVDFTRISSYFGKRKHPILNQMKNHHGVDYAAPRGTPIKAAGDGKLIFVGRKGGYGKTVIIQHGGKYSTLYAHMSRIKPGMHRGKRVRQGQVIGYVGSTGRSTGPHLHYEFRVNGVHRNPLRVRLPDAAPISAKYKSDFLSKSQGLVALLDVLNRNTTLALNDNGS